MEAPNVAGGLVDVIHVVLVLGAVKACSRFDG
jgi:hypothetical protein